MDPNWRQRESKISIRSGLKTIVLADMAEKGRADGVGRVLRRWHLS